MMCALYKDVLNFSRSTCQHLLYAIWHRQGGGKSSWYHAMAAAR